MRQLLMLAAVAGLVVARPEVYREKEDFQFSRSSTDEGSKSGYYGAQRGNMGGNYERAHNMDPLAQNQMSGLVRTVEGELGDGAKQKTGSVFTSANSRGVYGSGNYDLSNLAGRNFQEGDSHSSQSHSSLTSHHGSAYKGQFSESDQARYGSSQTRSSGYRQAHDSRYGGYNSAENSAQVLYPNSHDSSSIHSASQFEDRTLAQNSGYAQSAGYQSQDYDQGRSLSHTSSGYGSNIHSRLVSGNPVRIVIRPGTKVVLPVAAQTYDASQSISAFDQNAINSETEVLNANNQHESLKPRNKQYESSYSYRKEWEKHDTRPVSVVPLSKPTENPYPSNSELYTDTQAKTLEQQRQSASRIASQNYHSSHSGYNVNSASSSQSRQADYNTHSSDANAGYSSYNGGYNEGINGAYNAGASSANNRKIASSAYIGNANGLNQIDDSKTRPKTYQSAYSYHKSWEHQGDPYVIKPSTNGIYDGQVSDKLTAESLNQGAYGSHQYRSQHQTHQAYSGHSDVDCDEQGHIRVARSPSSYNYHQTKYRGDVIGQEDLGQQTQQHWDNIHELSQQTQPKWENTEDLGQQTQNDWEQIGQQTENKWDKLQDESQQTQTLWGPQMTQQTQLNQWGQQNVGQQTQNSWDNLELEPQKQTELEQQAQDTWTTMDAKPSGPDSSRQDNYGIITQSNDHKLNTESHTLDTSANQSTSHHVHTIWDEIKKEEIGQENEDSVETLTEAADLGQQIQVTWSNINKNENSFNPWHQKTEDKGELDLTNSEQNNKFINTPNPHPWMYNQMHHHQDNRSNSNQYFSHNSSSNSFSGSNSHVWQEHSTNMNSNSLNSHALTHSSGSTFGSSVMSLWDKLDNIEKHTMFSHNTNDKVNQNDLRDEGTASVIGISAQPNVLDTSAKPQQPLITAFSTNSTPSTGDKVLPHNVERGDIEPEVSSNSHDIGRGDIEPENSSNEQSKPVDKIETLSISKYTDRVDKHDVAHDKLNNEDNIDLSVMSLDQQNHSHSQDEQKEHSMWQSGASGTSAMNSTHGFHYINHKDNANHWNDANKNRNTEQQVENIDQQNLHQQRFYSQFVQHQENEHANTDQKHFDFGQQSENVGSEQMEQQLEVQNIGPSENFQQENQKHEAEELGPENEQFDKVSLSGWKPDDNQSQHEHKLKNWGQKNLGQQNQSTAWVENMEQQVQTAWKPTEDLQQQSQLSDTFEVPVEDLSQQVQPAWNPTDGLQQHSKLSDTFGPPIEDLSQQVQPAWNPTDDLQQHSKLSDTFGPPIEDLRQQVQPAWNPTDDLQQHSKLSDTFGPPIEDLSQQVQPAWNPTEDLQQHSELSGSFSQPMKNLDQQEQTAWKPIEDHHQSQITDTFSSKENQNEKLPSTLHKQPDIVEELTVPKKAPVVYSPSETETITVKPGFWKSVGNKFTNAKDKVSSWFSS